MKVIVDTCVWSLELRRKSEKKDRNVDELRQLIEEFRVQMIGPISQKLLSGVKSEKQFRSLRNYLSFYPDLVLESEIYVRAAEIFNANRKKGIQGSNTDFLICAVSEIHEMPMFTTDKDFFNFSKISPLYLHEVR